MNACPYKILRHRVLRNHIAHQAATRKWAASTLVQV